jgi:hypothetical protein
MTIHQYLMQASKDDARRAGERDRVLLEARRVGQTRRPGASLAALVTRDGRLLSRWTAWARERLGKRARPAGEVQPTPTNGPACLAAEQGVQVGGSGLTPTGRVR